MEIIRYGHHRYEKRKVTLSKYISVNQPEVGFITNPDQIYDPEPSIDAYHNLVRNCEYRVWLLTKKIRTSD